MNSSMATTRVSRYQHLTIRHSRDPTQMSRLVTHGTQPMSKTFVSLGFQFRNVHPPQPHYSINAPGQLVGCVLDSEHDSSFLRGSEQRLANLRQFRTGETTSDEETSTSGRDIYDGDPEISRRRAPKVLFLNTHILLFYGQLMPALASLVPSGQ